MAKRVLSMLLCLLMLVALLPVFAAAASDATEINIDVTKNWVDDGADRPASVTVRLLADGVDTGKALELTADNGWQGSFGSLPVSYDGETDIVYTIAEDELDGYAVSYEQPGPGDVTLSYLTEFKGTAASENVYDISEYNITVAKKGHLYYVWTLEPLGSTQEQLLMDAVNAANVEGLGADLTKDNTIFKSGLGIIFEVGNDTIEIRSNGNEGVEIYFSKTNIWSLFTVGEATVSAQTTASVTNTKKIYSSVHNDLTLTKLDQDGNALAGAEFTLYADENCETALKSFTAGTAVISAADEVFEGLLPTAGGSVTFYLKETNAPAGYIRDEAVYSIVISAYESEEYTSAGLVITTAYTVSCNGSATLSVENTKNTDAVVEHSSLTVNKLDQDKAALEGAEFTLYADEALTEEVMSFEAGIKVISTGDEALAGYLPYAGQSKIFYLVETKAPEGYKAAAGSFAITVSAAENEALKDGKFVTTTTYIINANGESVLEVVNVKETDADYVHASFTVKKTDGDGNALDGAEFTVYSDEKLTEAVYSFTAGETVFTTDKAELADMLPADGESIKLYMKETKAPEGYVKADATVVIEISAKSAEALKDGKFVTTTTYSLTVNGQEASSIIVKNVKEVQPVTVSVKKVWKDKEDSVRPKSVTVVLYKDGKEYDKITLSAENSWKCKWVELDGNSKWTVDEVNVPDGYTKKVTNDGYDFTITNYDKRIPATGDTNNTALWLALLTVSTMGMAAVVLFKKHGKAEG